MTKDQLTQMCEAARQALEAIDGAYATLHETLSSLDEDVTAVSHLVQAMQERRPGEEFPQLEAVCHAVTHMQRTLEEMPADAALDELAVLEDELQQEEDEDEEADEDEEEAKDEEPA